MRSVWAEPGARADLYEHCPGPTRIDERPERRRMQGGRSEPIATLHGWWWVAPLRPAHTGRGGSRGERGWEGGGTRLRLRGAPRAPIGLGARRGSLPARVGRPGRRRRHSFSSPVSCIAHEDPGVGAGSGAGIHDGGPTAPPRRRPGRLRGTCHDLEGRETQASYVELVLAP